MRERGCIGQRHFIYNLYLVCDVQYVHFHRGDTFSLTQKLGACHRTLARQDCARHGLDSSDHHSRRRDRLPASHQRGTSSWKRCPAQESGLHSQTFWSCWSECSPGTHTRTARWKFINTVIKLNYFPHLNVGMFGRHLHGEDGQSSL